MVIIPDINKFFNTLTGSFVVSEVSRRINVYVYLVNSWGLR